MNGLRQSFSILGTQQTKANELEFQCFGFKSEHSGPFGDPNGDSTIDLRAGDFLEQLATFALGREKEAVKITLGKQHSAAELIEG